MDRRNIAIIAHVDHGKTTLVDAMFRQSGAVRENQRAPERALDRNPLERERGITILSKCTAIDWQSCRINIVDTPGHADFGGEVERVLRMVDGVLLLVDAAEGPMPQTKFVTAKALALGLKPIVVINKVDRPDARPHQVVDAVFDLFAALDASEAQLDFACLFAAGRDGWAGPSPDGPHGDLAPLFETIIARVPAPRVDPDAAFRLLVTILEPDAYLGRVLIGRIESGAIAVNGPIRALRQGAGIVEQTRVVKLMSFHGLERVPVERAEAGDIVAIAGLDIATVADTLAAPQVTAPLPAMPIDPPVLAMTFGINDSPLAGRSGDKLTGRMLRARLAREAESNVAIEVSDGTSDDLFEVAGRGELQLAVLIETMRREGFEMTIGRPRVLFREDPRTGARLEPVEEVVIDVDEAHAGVVVETLSQRRGTLQDMRSGGGDKTRLNLLVPTRALIGYHGEFLTATRGSGIMHRLFHGYLPVRGAIEGRRSGVLVSSAGGRAVAYALWNLEERGRLFIEPGADLYPGMIVGENARPQDLEVNPTRAKQLTNFRAAGKDDAIRLTPPTILSLEQAMAFIDDDEAIEVTPRDIRLRKRLLDEHARKRARRARA